MKRKKTKKKTGFGLSSKSNLFAKKNCPLSKKNEDEINYKNLKLLKKYISDSAKILPTRITNVSHSKQKILVREIKRARALALLPYVGN
jgi:small subunit ribosomal protein S18